MSRPSIQLSRSLLESLYQKYNRRCFVHPDPIEKLYTYDRLEDREIAAWIAASLAYGRVHQILKSIGIVLHLMGDSPYQYLREATAGEFRHDYSHFVHRFATGAHIAGLLDGLKGLILAYGTLGECFHSGIAKQDTNVLPALGRLIDRIYDRVYRDPGHLLPRPERGSACKRLNLFLRWMVRQDRVDPGGWEAVSAAKLIVPLDTHMFRIGQMAGMTSRRQGDMRAALEMTEKFKMFSPNDPVRYDFALTRIGILRDPEFNELRDWNEEKAEISFP